MDRSKGFHFRLGFAFSSGFRYGSKLKVAQDSLSEDAPKWITVHPGGKGPKANGKGMKGGSPVLIESETGEILGGMGGKFTGKTMGQMKQHRENFVGPRRTVAQANATAKKAQNSAAPSSNQAQQTAKINDWLSKNRELSSSELSTVEGITKHMQLQSSVRERRRAIPKEDKEKISQAIGGKENNLKLIECLKQMGVSQLVQNPQIFIHEVFGAEHAAEGVQAILNAGREAKQKNESAQVAARAVNVNRTKLSTEKLQSLVDGGKHWEKGGNSRTYLDGNDLADALGFKVTRENGKVTGAIDPNGNEMSRSKAKMLLERLSQSYFDHKTGKIMSGSFAVQEAAGA